MDDRDRTIAFIVNDRPEYLARTLESWEDARDIYKWVVNFHVEPTQHVDWQLRMIDDFRFWSRAQGEVIVNESILGCARNAHAAMNYAFDTGASFAVLAEDDVLVSDDVLTYFGHMAEKEEVFPESIVVCASNTRQEGVEDFPEGYEYRAWFKPMVWGTWADRWESIVRPTWDFDYSSGTDEHPGGWDCNLGFRVIPRHGRAIMPMQVRCQHIGIERGTHFTAAHQAQEVFPAFRLRRTPVDEWTLVGNSAPPYFVR